MHTTAAVLVEPGRPLEIAEIEVPPLAAGQVLVELSYSGVCRTQLLETSGARGEDPYLPHCLGHEGSGTVLETGPGVKKCRAGEQVILSWIEGTGQSVPGTVYRWGNRRVNAGAVTTFQRHAVVSESRITVLEPQLPLVDAALLGCAIPTGFGAIINTAAMKEGEVVAVFGAGGIGLCAVAAAVLGGAAAVVAVDIHDSRLELAREYGATAVVNAKNDDPCARISELVPRGVDVAIEASGLPHVMQQALEVVHPRGGRAVVVGNAPHGQVLRLDPHQLNLGKRLLGSWGGDNQPERDFPRYARLVSENEFDPTPLRPRLYVLDEINQALDDLQQGRIPRPVVDLTKRDRGGG